MSIEQKSTPSPQGNSVPFLHLKFLSCDFLSSLCWLVIFLLLLILNLYIFLIVRHLVNLVLNRERCCPAPSFCAQYSLSAKKQVRRHQKLRLLLATQNEKNADVMLFIMQFFEAESRRPKDEEDGLAHSFILTGVFGLF